MAYIHSMNGTWEVYYYEDVQGAAPVKAFIKKLPARERAKVLAFIGLLESHGPYLPRPYADLLKDGIHELRIKLSGTQTRVLYFFCYQDIVILTNGFEKHSGAVPEREIQTAVKRRADFLARFPESKLRSEHAELPRPS